MSRVVNQKKEEVMVKEWVSRKWWNWYQNEVDKEIKGIDSRDRKASDTISTLLSNIPLNTASVTIQQSK